MRTSLLLRTTALTLALFAGGGALGAAPSFANTAPAGHTPAQVTAAVQQALAGANLTGKQKLEIHAMVHNYQAQTAGADPATLPAAQKNLLRSIYGILTPAQQSVVKTSLQQSLGGS